MKVFAKIASATLALALMTPVHAMSVKNSYDTATFERGGEVKVRSYCRKDGVCVSEHTRKRPSR